MIPVHRFLATVAHRTGQQPVTSADLARRARVRTLKPSRVNHYDDDLLQNYNIYYVIIITLSNVDLLYTVFGCDTY